MAIISMGAETLSVINIYITMNRRVKTKTIFIAVVKQYCNYWNFLFKKKNFN